MSDDLQIGITGEREPEYCGCGCGEMVRGRHSVAHSLGNGRYTTYLAKHDYKWNEAHPPATEGKTAFRQIVLTPPAPSAPAPETKKGKESAL